MYRCLAIPDITKILHTWLVSQTWRKDLSPCLLFFLADEVTLLRSLYTINVSSSSAHKYIISVLSSSLKCERGRYMFCQMKKAHTFHTIIASRWIWIEIIVCYILHCALQSATRGAGKLKSKKGMSNIQCVNISFTGKGNLENLWTLKYTE